jgi:hypothetical protein
MSKKAAVVKNGKSKQSMKSELPPGYIRVDDAIIENEDEVYVPSALIKRGQPPSRERVRDAIVVNGIACRPSALIPRDQPKIPVEAPIKRGNAIKKEVKVQYDETDKEEVRKNAVIVAQFNKGSIVKSLGEAISNYGRTRFQFDQEGMKIFDADENDQPEVVDRGFFKGDGGMREYRCKEPISFTITSKKFQTYSKSIKVKDSVSLIVPSRASRQFVIEVRVPGAESVSEHFPIVFAEDEPDVVNYNTPGPECYEKPMTISSSGFQRAKKKGGPQSTVTVKIQPSHYIEISQGKESSSFTAGVKNQQLPIFSAEFNVKLIARLTKIATFGENISFYAPKEAGCPIKIETITKSAGWYICFIKSKDRIEQDSQIEVVEKPVAKASRKKYTGDRTK